VTIRIEQFDPAADATRLRACFEMTQAGWPLGRAISGIER